MLEGNEDYHYPVIKQGNFKKLIYKFDNYQEIIFQWYEKEECHQYLIELWKNYIKIEGIESIDDKKLAEYLESQSINYSSWPDNIKEDFKLCCRNTNDSFVQKYKDEMKRTPQISEIINDLKEIKNDCIKMDKFLPAELQNKVEENSIIIMGKIILNTILSLYIGCWTSNINNNLEKKKIKKLAKCLTKDGICDTFEEAMKMAAEEIQNCQKNCTNMACFKCREKVEDSSLFSRVFGGKEEYEESTKEYDISKFLDKKKITKEIFKNKLTYLTLAAVSLVNLYWSIKQFKEIHSDLEKLKYYKNELKKIKKKFEEHTEKLIIIDDDDSFNFIDNLKKVKDNIQTDKDDLKELINKIQNEINNSSNKRNWEIAGVIGSLAMTTVGGVGVFVTKGIEKAVYGASSIGNLFSAGLHVCNSVEISNYIGGLEKILKEAKVLNNSIVKCIDDLTIKLKEKKLEYPDFYKKVEEIRGFQDKQRKPFF